MAALRLALMCLGLVMAAPTIPSDLTNFLNNHGSRNHPGGCARSDGPGPEGPRHDHHREEEEVPGGGQVLGPGAAHCGGKGGVRGKGGM